MLSILSNKDQSCSDRSSSSNRSEESTEKNTRTGRSTRTGRIGRRDVLSTASMIIGLKKKKEDSDKQAFFLEELSSMDGVLEKAKQRLDDDGILTILFLKALIKSKGADPPAGRKKAPFEAAWKKVKHKADWTRTVIFSEQDVMALELLEDDDSTVGEE